MGTPNLYSLTPRSEARTRGVLVDSKRAERPVSKPEQLEKVFKLLLSIDLGDEHFSSIRILNKLRRTFRRCRVHLNLNSVVLLKGQYHLPENLWDSMSGSILEVILKRLESFQPEDLPFNFSLALGLVRREDVDNFNRVLAGKKVLLYLTNTGKIVRYR